jgi:hypothetical protein
MRKKFSKLFVLTVHIYIMNMQEYKLFHQLSEVFKKANKLGLLKQLLTDQRALRLEGISQNYEWILVVKKK